MYEFILQNSNEYKMFIDATPDTKNKNIISFKKNRIVPVYFFFKHNNHKTAYILKTNPGNKTFKLINRPVMLLVSVYGQKAKKLFQITSFFRFKKIALDTLPITFFSQLSLHLQSRSFSLVKAYRFYKKFE